MFPSSFGIVDRSSQLAASSIGTRRQSVASVFLFASMVVVHIIFVIAVLVVLGILSASAAFVALCHAFKLASTVQYCIVLNSIYNIV